MAKPSSVHMVSASRSDTINLRLLALHAVAFMLFCSDTRKRR